MTDSPDKAGKPIKAALILFALPLSALVLLAGCKSEPQRFDMFADTAGRRQSADWKDYRLGHGRHSDVFQCERVVGGAGTIPPRHAYGI